MHACIAMGCLSFTKSNALNENCFGSSRALLINQKHIYTQILTKADLNYKGWDTCLKIYIREACTNQLNKYWSLCIYFICHNWSIHSFELLLDIFVGISLNCFRRNTSIPYEPTSYKVFYSSGGKTR